MARARATTVDRPGGSRTPTAKLLRTFVSLVSRLPFAEQVFAMPGCEGIEIWTVIDANPFEEGIPDQVYQAELDAMGSVPGTLVLFRLINRREYAGDSLEYVLPSADRIVWQRAG